MKLANQGTVGTVAAEAIETYLRQAEAYERPVLQDRDSEDLHQMRVSLRQLRTVMQVFAPSVVLPKAGREAHVANIFRCLGKLRDIDVTIATLETQYGPDLPQAEREVLNKLVKTLLKQRKQIHKRVKNKLTSDRYGALKESLHRWSSSPECKDMAKLHISAILPDLTLPLVSQLWLHPGWFVAVKEVDGSLQPRSQLSMEAIDSILIESEETLHSLRKQVKRVRYQLKFASTFYGDRLDSPLSKLSKLQSTLGKFQDNSVMTALLVNSIPDWKTTLPTLASLLSDSRYRTWKRWQTLQQYYLDASHRAALRNILVAPEGPLVQKKQPS